MGEGQGQMTYEASKETELGSPWYMGNYLDSCLVYCLQRINFKIMNKYLNLEILFYRTERT